MPATGSTHSGISLSQENNFARYSARFNLSLGRFISWLNLAMLGCMLLTVCLRYLFNTGSIAIQESAVYLHGIIFMGAMGYTLQQDAHVRVDIFYRKMSRPRQLLVDSAGILIFVLPFTVFLFAASFDYVAVSWARGEGSADAGGLSFLYILKSMLLVMPAILIIQSSLMLAQNLLSLKQQKTGAQ